MKEAIVLAGGLGTRLRSVVSDLPKCMAPVNGKPFLEFVINYFHHQRIEKFIFALGYKHELIESYLQSLDKTFEYSSSIEEEPLGTGGAIKLALQKASEKNILILNGDTFFKINLVQLSNLHQQQNADCTLCLKPMKNFSRYGVVELNDDLSIRQFKEKQFYETGLINGGVYALNVEKFLKKDFATKFSFEKDYLEKFYTQRKFTGCLQDEYFIDIGIPEDYEKVQLDFLNGIENL